MKKLYYTFFLALLCAFTYGQDLIISGVMDGPLSGGVPKVVELYVVQDIPDLSAYGIGSANNGGGTDGEELTFPNDSYLAGSFIYIASEEPGFNSFFGFTPNYTSSAANINGDDAIELFMNGAVVDVFGDIAVDGTGQPWDYLDGWAYRVDNTGPDGITFNLTNWTFSGTNALDGATSNAGAATPFPIGSFNGGVSNVIENPSNFNALVDGLNSIDLSWSANTDGDQVVLAFSETGALTDSPDNGTSYTAGQTLSDGSTILYVGNANTFDHQGLLENTTYFYKIWSVDGSVEYSSGLSTDATTESSTPNISLLIITGVLDGPLSGGVPKMVELLALEDIADLSTYGIGSANNGGGTDGEEFSFPADNIQKGDYIYIASESSGFEDFFGFAPDYTSGSMGINGDDAVELFLNGAVADVFGDINTDGTGQPWEYLDGWAYRKDNTGPDGSTFVLSNWTFSGTNALDGSLTNATANTPFPLASYGPDLILTGVMDGPLSGGVPKAVEFYAKFDISDLSEYGFGSANNGGGTDGEEFTFPAVSVPAGSFIYVASENTGFTNYFGFGPDYTSSAANVNGDDAIELFHQGEVLDVFGDINLDGSGQPWEYLDSWAYRVNGTGPDGATFVLTNWTFGGPNVLDGSSTNATASSPFPIGTYGTDGPVVELELITIAEARALPGGEPVMISGVLTVSDQMGGPAYIQDASGGVAIFDASVHGSGLFSIGDSLTITGVRNSFNDQIQISPVTELISHGLANNFIEPISIGLNELADHPGELIRIVDPNFPSPGDLMFENSNYLITDNNGTGELRIDRDVTDLVGLVQPNVCDELIGVVGRFFETYQILPRQESDLACAEEYTPPAPPSGVDLSSTLDIGTWNIEWFGDEGNSPAAGMPNSDAIQKDSVRTIIQQLQPDILAVQEISDDALFAQLVSELPGYDYILSPAVSRPNDPGTKQKVGFIYNTETVSLLSSKVLLESIHPLYNGGDASALVNYPNDTDRFYATGRLPFLISTEIMINGEMANYEFVALHARANSGSDAQNRYDMRKYDVEVLKDSLDAFYGNSNLVLLGDYNDDVDETVADIPSTISSYEEYSNDGINYDVLTRVLSDNNFRSFVFRENMIDHISVSDELSPLYIPQTAQVHYEFYDADYTRTASDHFPVSVRLALRALTLENISSTDVVCFGESDATALVEVSGGIAPYSYLWSDGQMDQMATGLSAGMYSVVVTDQIGNTIESSVTISEPADPVSAIISPNPTVYFGYAPQECATLEVLSIEGGMEPYTVQWSTGETSLSIIVCPEETENYIVSITDANGCLFEQTISVLVIDVRCGNNSNNPKVLICHNGKTKCISANAVQAHLNHGDYLGPCDESSSYNGLELEVVVSPNPFVENFRVEFEGDIHSKAQFVITNMQGQEVFKQSFLDVHYKQQIDLGTSNLPSGVYSLSIFFDNTRSKVVKLIKF